MLAEERRKAKQEALEWSQAFKVDSDEEKERKPKKTRKPKSEPVSGDEGEPKKRRRKIKKHEETEDIMLSEEEEDQKPAKKVYFTNQLSHPFWLLILNSTSAQPKSESCGMKMRKRLKGLARNSCTSPMVFISASDF